MYFSWAIVYICPVTKQKNMTKTEREVQKFQRAMAMLVSISHDHQMVEGTNSYVGFLNVGKGGYMPYVIGLSGKQLKDTWQYIVERADLFVPIIDALGMATEEGLHLEETVFVPKK